MKWIKYSAVCLPLVWLTCNTNPYRQGERLYNRYCANCHMEDGSGLLSLYPSLSSSEFKRFNDQFACIVRIGLKDTLTIDRKEFVFPMPANPELNNITIANIYNYITYKWHPDLPPTTAVEVQSDLETCPD